jgi:shikimate kinase
MTGGRHPILSVAYWAVNSVGSSIVLIGMMGAGKSSVGRCLQRRTQLPLFDTDDLVAARFGISIPEIFAKHGEDKFREAETEALHTLAATERAIIVTGGGSVLREQNIEVLRRLGVVVWVDCSRGALFKRASRSGNRPLLQCDNPREAFARMLKTRLPLYAKVAKLRVDTSVLTDEEVAVAILSKLRRLGANPEPGSPISMTA